MIIKLLLIKSFAEKRTRIEVDTGVVHINRLSDVGFNGYVFFWQRL